MSVKFEAIFCFRSKIDFVFSANHEQLILISWTSQTFDFFFCLSRQSTDGIDCPVVDAQGLFSLI
jgi:hypothetical protein